MLEEMAAAGYITQEQLGEMLSDLEAWESGDESTRAALMEKYSSTHHIDDYPSSFKEYQTSDYDTTNHTYYNYEYANYLQGLEKTSNTAAQDSATNSSTVADGIATRTQLAQVQTGQFYYTTSGTFTQTMKNGVTSNIAGTMNVTLNIDFGSRTIGGGGSQLSVNTSSYGGDISSGMSIGSQSFDSTASNTSLATYTKTNGNLTGEFSIKNSGGVIGQTMDATATYDNGSDVGSGTVTDVSRTSGTQ
jgi:hypothetical protein